MRTCLFLFLAMTYSAAAPSADKAMFATVQEYSQRAGLTGSEADRRLLEWLHGRLSAMNTFHSIAQQQYSIGPVLLPSNCTVSFGADHAARCYPVQPAPCQSRTVLHLPRPAVHFAAGPWLNYELTNDDSLQPPAGGKQLIVVNDDWTAVGESYVAEAGYNQSAFVQERSRTLPRPYDWQYRAFESSLLLPAIQLPPRAFRAAAESDYVTLNLTGSCTNASSANLIARLQSRGCRGASDTPKKTIIISTPINSFGPGGGERGPGVAIALWLGSELPNIINEIEGWCVEVVFGFLSGHNEGSLGTKQFLSELQRVQLGPESVDMYVTLGADIANQYSFKGNNYQGAADGVMLLTPRAVPALWEALKVAIGSANFVNATEIEGTSTAGGGDNRYIYAAGYSMVSWQGLQGPRFHMATDLASTTDSKLLSVAGDMVLTTIQRVLGGS